jgi:hypothetical protein
LMSAVDFLRAVSSFLSFSLDFASTEMLCALSIAAVPLVYSSGLSF